MVRIAPYVMDVFTTNKGQKLFTLKEAFSLYNIRIYTSILGIALF